MTPVGGARTINSCGGSVFQYGDAFDVVGVHIVHAPFDTVHQDQWGVGIERTVTTHAMVAPSEPGCPEACVTFIPAASPERAEETLMMGRPSVWSAKLMEVTEPVRFTFFCTP